MPHRCFIDAAFRSSVHNQAYFFMKNEYVLVNYNPGTTNDKIVHGPRLIRDGFPSLAHSPFGKCGIDCAFDTDHNEAFIFCTNICARIDYAPHSSNDRVLSGPMAITSMFPFFKGTAFENGIDAALRSSRSKEAYLFKGDQYALINYDSKHLIHIRTFKDGFRCFLGTVFESGIDAAFASHKKPEAYIFKGEYYVRITFGPGSTDNIIGRVNPILNWTSFRSILPRKN